jgi:CDP-diacylglycerol--serine O-phosphatidyltransferase
MRAPVHELHAANLLTYVSLMCAVTASLAHSHRTVAGVGLALAVVADTFDGRFARAFARTERQHHVGRELDSLVDAIAFGLAPVMVLAATAPHAGFADLLSWWVAAAAYVGAAVTRLAFYNVEGDGARFVGLPAPAAALVCATSLVLPTPAWANAWPLVVGAVAMVAPFSFPRPRGLGLAAFVAWALAVIATLAR